MQNDVKQVDRDAALDWSGIDTGFGYKGDFLADLAADFAAHRIVAEAAKDAEYADKMKALQAPVPELEGRLQESIESELWAAYAVGFEKDGQWTHQGMSDGEGLCHTLDLDCQLFWHDAAVMKAAIPDAAARMAKEPAQ